MAACAFSLRRHISAAAAQHCQDGVKMSKDATAADQRIREELADGYDKEFELELDDARLDALVRDLEGRDQQDTVERRSLFQGAVPPAGRAGQAAGLGGRTRSSRWW